MRHTMAAPSLGTCDGRGREEAGAAEKDQGKAAAGSRT